MTNDDTGHVLEQKALRNVRALVDKLEAEDRNRWRSELQVVLAALLVVGGLVGMLALAFFIDTGGRTKSYTISTPGELRKPTAVDPGNPRPARAESSLAVEAQ